MKRFRVMFAFVTGCASIYASQSAQGFGGGGMRPEARREAPSPLDRPDCPPLGQPGSDPIRREILEAAQRLGLAAEALQRIRLCDNPQMDPMLLASYDNDRVLLEFNRNLAERLERENESVAGRPDLAFLFQTLMALNKALLFRPGRGDADAPVLEMEAARLTGEDLANSGYTPDEITELNETLRAYGQALNDPAAEHRSDWLLRAYQRQYARLHPRPQPPPQAAPVKPDWQSYAAGFERWMAWIASIGGGIAVLYGGWEWLRRRRRPKRR